MAKDKTPVSPAVRELRAARVEFTDHLYTYEEKGGTEVSARELGVAEHSVIKTLIMQDDSQAPLVVLMHGDKQVSTKELARLIGVKTISPCSPEVAQRHTGYMVGGTSPFGTRRKLPVFMERTILELPRIYINGGKRGYLIGVSPADAVHLLQPRLVTVAVAK
ncbi:MAG: Cys-tRNA(Pro) deacylase [Betaproteobacteria bacterium]